MTKIITERLFDSILVLRLNDLKKLNALSTDLLEELNECLEGAIKDELVRSIIITGSPYLFSIGADKTELFSEQIDINTIKHRNQLYRKIALIDLPVIAAVCGPAVGGGFELALSCDIIIAGKSAKFSLPETALGIIPAAGGTQRLIRTTGKSLTMQMILAGKELNATEAKEVGIISDVCDDKNCLSNAIELAKIIVNRPKEAVQFAKKSILSSYELILEEGLNLEHDFLLRLRNGKY
jgi:enoyl-CoA hydratase/carnithine racemase